METVTWAQVLGWRMRRQFLDPAAGGGPVAVARRLAGVQAQVASAAELAIASRQADPRRGAVAEALADGTLVKTWAMRGTLHLLPADEAAAYLELSAAHRNQGLIRSPMSYCAAPRRRLAALSSVAGQHQADSLLRLARHHLDTARYGRGLRMRP